MNRKKIWSILLILTLCVGLFSGCKGGSSEDISANGIKMYMTVSSSDTFRQNLMDEAKKLAEEMGAEIKLVDAEGSLENQMAQIREAVDGGYDVILCNPVDIDTTLQLQVVAGDLPMVFWNSCPSEERLEGDKYVFAGSNEADAGTYQGEFILDHFSDQDTINIAIMEGQKLHPAALGRTNALKAVLDDSDKQINYVYDDNADWDLDTAKAQFDVFLKTGQKVDVVACNNDNMALGVLQSCEEHGISPDEITVIGVDATDVGCAAIEEGKMAFTVCQSAIGQATYAVKAAARLAQKKSLKGLNYLSENHKYIWVPFEKVDLSNVAKYK